MIGILAAKYCDEGADVIDNVSKWMSFHDTLAYVEATKKCCEDIAIRLLQQAAHDLKIGTRVVQSSPQWVVSGDRYYEDDGRDLQFCREDVLKLWPQQEKEAAAPSRSRIGGGAISVGVRLALDALYPHGVPEGLRAKDRDTQVVQWLKDNKKVFPRTYRRPSKERVDGHEMLQQNEQPLVGPSPDAYGFD